MQAHETKKPMLGVTMRFEATIRVNVQHLRALSNKKSADQNATMTFKGLALCAHKGNTHALASCLDTPQTLVESCRLGDRPVLYATMLVAYGSIGSSTT